MAVTRTNVVTFIFGMILDIVILQQIGVHLLRNVGTDPREWMGQHGT